MSEETRGTGPEQRARYWIEHAPYTYLGVAVPEDLRPNWDELELHWWRMGVRAARKHDGGTNHEQEPVR